jgi:hypothetical protein
MMTSPSSAVSCVQRARGTGQEIELVVRTITTSCPLPGADVMTKAAKE